MHDLVFAQELQYASLTYHNLLELIFTTSHKHNKFENYNSTDPAPLCDYDHIFCFNNFYKTHYFCFK